MAGEPSIAAQAFIYGALALCGANLAIHAAPPYQDREAAKLLGALAGLAGAYWVNKKLWIKA